LTNRYRTIVVVHVLLRSTDGHVLLLERANTGSADGQLCLPGGHLEEGESVIAGAIRETGEETGVDLDEAGLEFAHVVHRRDGRDDPRIGVFFVATAGTVSRSTRSRTSAHDCFGQIPRIRPSTSWPTPPRQWQESPNGSPSPSTAGVTRRKLRIPCRQRDRATVD
jgi:8-oxo-dGTP pyrophosphatase MutT (NUDIX family)